MQVTPDWEALTAKVEADPALVKQLGWVSWPADSRGWPAGGRAGSRPAQGAA